MDVSTRLESENVPVGVVNVVNTNDGGVVAIIDPSGVMPDIVHVTLPPAPVKDDDAINTNEPDDPAFIVNGPATLRDETIDHNAREIMLGLR